MPDSRGKFNPFDTNWKEFGKQFMSSYEETDNQEFSWIEDYVRDILSQVLPDEVMQNSSMSMPSRPHPSVFDTHHDTIVRVKVPEHTSAQELKVFFNTSQLRILGLEEKEKVIPLPTPGRFDGSKAVFKDNILEIRIPKELNELYQEVNIQYL